MQTQLFPCASHPNQEKYCQIGQDGVAVALWRSNKHPRCTKEDHDMDLFTDVHLKSFSWT